MSGGKDLYMNFMSIDVDLDAADSTTVVEQQVNTGLSVRGGLAWLIHLVEIYFTDASVHQNYLLAALSTRHGETEVPTIFDGGCIAAARRDSFTAGSAYWTFDYQPKQINYLPAIPIAAQSISLYAASETNSATYQGETIEVRIGYTTVELDAKMYLEIAEAWGYGN